MPLDPKQQPPYYTIDDNLPTPVDPIVPEGTKVYIAILTQTSTNAPTQTVIYNTLTNTPTWTYDSTGTYKCTLTGEFTNNKCIGYVNNNQGPLIQYIINDAGAPNYMLLTVYQLDPGTGYGQADGKLTDTPITIYVYP